MKVSELIQMLSTQDQDATVRFAYDYGDHCHHMIASKVSYVEHMPIRYSLYVDKMVLLQDDEEDEGETAVVIQ